MKKLFAALVGIAVATTSIAAFAPDQADAAARRTRTIEITWCWGATEVSPHCPVQEVTLHRGGTSTTVWAGQSEPGQWTYDRQTKTLTLTFDNYPGVTYEGTKRRGCFTGTMTNTVVGVSGVWSGCYI